MIFRVLFSLLILGSALRAATPDEVAKFLAGIPVADGALASQQSSKAWEAHSTSLNAAWKQLDGRQLSKIKSWAADNLKEETEQRKNLYYFFSGPDELYAGTLFPNAANTVLVALEPVGELPEIDKLPADALAPSLANLRKSMDAVLSFSFFITKIMKDDLHHQQLAGTLPVILVFLARSGAQVQSVDLIGIDKEGSVTTDEKPAARGAKIGFQRPGGGPAQTVYYFSTDLSDGALKHNPAVLKFCDNLGRGCSLLKAASFLLHGGNFDIVKKYILANSDCIVQDDSGIPYKAYDGSKWDVQLFGHYTGPIKLFAKNNQPDLVAAYKELKNPSLGFSFGYQWQPSLSDLILARPKK